eukprot:TRINITY_DN2014_c0_g1_i1.p1 TRINITY_DN2014_c0_g1~~TRINITY_DN2014_c0_g1_i1.p1  ORF type:complete len:604 (+),score=106.67 TRINITY_DN2014_c0_g1_i1:65-1813(+)
MRVFFACLLVCTSALLGGVVGGKRDEKRETSLRARRPLLLGEIVASGSPGGLSPQADIGAVSSESAFAAASQLLAAEGSDSLGAFSGLPDGGLPIGEYAPEAMNALRGPGYSGPSQSVSSQINELEERLLRELSSSNQAPAVRGSGQVQVNAGGFLSATSTRSSNAALGAISPSVEVSQGQVPFAGASPGNAAFSALSPAAAANPAEMAFGLPQPVQPVDRSPVAAANPAEMAFGLPQPVQPVDRSSPESPASIAEETAALNAAAAAAREDLAARAGAATLLGGGKQVASTADLGGLGSLAGDGRTQSVGTQTAGDVPVEVAAQAAQSPGAQGTSSNQVYVPGLGYLRADTGTPGIVANQQPQVVVVPGGEQVLQVSDMVAEGGCPTGTLPITSAEECQRASDKLFETGSLTVTQMASVIDPQGCWIYGCEGKMQALVFNCQGTQEFRRPSRNMICMRTGADFFPVLEPAPGCEVGGQSSSRPGPIVVNVHLHVDNNGSKAGQGIDVSSDSTTPAAAEEQVTTTPEIAPTMEPLDNGTPANMTFEMGHSSARARITSSALATLTSALALSIAGTLMMPQAER